MKVKALVLDLDNTIYPVSSIGDVLFRLLFELIFSDARHTQNVEAIRSAVMRRPFQVVAREFSFSDELTAKGVALLKNLTYDHAIETFPDYDRVREIPVRKFLVTAGFLMLQKSKIRQLGIEKDFKAIFFVDPEVSDQSKKSVFRQILSDYTLQPNEVLVVGDDPESEIKAARELGINTVLFDFNNEHSPMPGQAIIRGFNKLGTYLL